MNLGSAQFLDCVEIVMPKLLDCVKDESRMVAQKTEEALEALISAIDPPQRCLQVLIPLIITEQSPVLQAAIRCVIPAVETRYCPGFVSLCFLAWHLS